MAGNHRYPEYVAVDKRILIGSLAAAVAISIGGGWALSQSDDAAYSPADSANDAIEISPNTVSVVPGLAVNELVEGDPLPDVDLTDLNGNTVTTGSLVGQPLVINIWATTCAPCKREMPALAAVQREMGDLVRFVGVNLAENTESARAFAKDAGVTYELLSDQLGNLTTALGVQGLPYTIFVTAEGMIVDQKGTELTQADIRGVIEDTLLS